MHESEHAEVYRTRCAALTRAEELLEAAKSALHPEENLSRASELARACVALLDEAAAPTCFADIAQALEPRVESDMMDAGHVQQQIDSCATAVAHAQDLMRGCGEQLSRGLCERAHGSLQEARSCLHAVGFTTLDSQLDLLHQHIAATQQLQEEEAAHAPKLNTEITQTHQARPAAATPTVDGPEQAPEPQEQADQPSASAQLHPDQLGLQDHTSASASASASASREGAGLPPAKPGLDIASHNNHHPPLSEAVAAAAVAAASAVAAEAEVAEAGAAAMTHASNAEAGLLRALELLASAGHP